MQIMQIYSGAVQLWNHISPHLISEFIGMVLVTTLFGTMVGTMLYGFAKYIFNLIFVIKKCPLCDEPKWDEPKPKIENE